MLVSAKEENCVGRSTSDRLSNEVASSPSSSLSSAQLSLFGVLRDLIRSDLSGSSLL